MDSTGFPPQNMGGQNQAMQMQQQAQLQQQQQQRQQQAQQQQRTGAAGANASQHIQQMIFAAVSNNTNAANLTGWQALIPIAERITLIFNM